MAASLCPSPSAPVAVVALALAALVAGFGAVAVAAATAADLSLVPARYRGKLLGLQVDYNRFQNTSVLLVDPVSGHIEWLDVFQEGIYTLESVLDLAHGQYWMLGSGGGGGVSAFGFNLSSGFIDARVDLNTNSIMNVHFDDETSFGYGMIFPDDNSVAIARVEFVSGSVAPVVEMPFAGSIIGEAAAYNAKEKLFYCVVGSSGNSSATYLVTASVGDKPAVVRKVTIAASLTPTPLFFDPVLGRLMTVGDVPSFVDPETGKVTPVSGGEELGGIPLSHAIVAYDGILYGAVEDFGIQKVVRADLRQGFLLDSNKVVADPEFLHFIPGTAA